MSRPEVFLHVISGREASARRIFRWAFLCVLLLLTSGQLLSATDRPDFLVNDDNSNAQQSDPRIAVAPDGSFAVVWTDKRRENNDIYLQRYGVNGLPVGRNVRVNDDLHTAYQARPALAADHFGRYLAAWQDYRLGQYPNDPDIIFQRYDSALTRLDTNVNITSPEPGYRDSPDLSLSSWGKGIIVWSDYRNGNWDIFGQLVDDAGTLLGDNFRINDDDGTAWQHAPRVSTSALGWFVVAWYDNRLGNEDIFVQRFDSAGTPLGSNVKINTDTGDHRQMFPDIATDGAGNFTVVWVDYRNGVYPANPDIYLDKRDTSMVSITGNIRLNTDGTLRAQRYPAIAADRMGNIAVIWADSTATSWDIVGQMIDVDGVVQEANFTANTFADSAQLKPDVALDGTNRYIVWMDRRNSDYDIYASITQYNDPGLIVEPALLEFVMSTGGPVPDTQYLVVDHGGYNALGFDVTPYNSWLACDPIVSTTPDTVAVSIAVDTLPDGIYNGAIAVVDREGVDSTYIIPVRLRVASSVLTVSHDSLYMEVPLGYDTSLARSFQISNSGLGDLDWTATENADWLVLSATSGRAPSTIMATVNPNSLAAGLNRAVVAIDAGVAEGSPDSVVIVLNVRDDFPVLAAAPTEIVATVENAAAFSAEITVTNLGGGSLAWSALHGADWLALSPPSGSDGDSITLTLLENYLVPGLNAATVTISDDSAFNGAVTVGVDITYDPQLSDTLRLLPTNVAPGQTGVVVLAASLHNRIAQLTVPLQFDTAAFRLDSVVFDPGLLPHIESSYRPNNTLGTLVLNLGRTSPDTVLAPGDYVLAEIVFTARNTQVLTRFDTLNNDTLSPLVVTATGAGKVPVVETGEIRIGNPTDITEPSDEPLPDEYVLRQNYPNPFNAATTIEFHLPRGGRVSLQVFDILGRSITSLTDRYLPAGRHFVIWDGRDRDGRSLATGVYFYRLQVDNRSVARKAALLK